MSHGADFVVDAKGVAGAYAVGVSDEPEEGFDGDAEGMLVEPVDPVAQDGGHDGVVDGVEGAHGFVYEVGEEASGESGDFLSEHFKDAA